MKRQFLSFVSILILVPAVLSAQPEQGIKTTVFLFEQAFDDLEDKESVLKPGGEWFPYPEYSDRSAWNLLCADFKKRLVASGEKYLDYQWYDMPLSIYLEYEKTGNRSLFAPEEANRAALKDLVLAELAEGNGRFLPQIADGLWNFAHKASWSHPQHTKYQASNRTVPTDDDRPVTYHSAVAGAEVAIAWHFFHKQLDEMDPSISIAVKESVRKNILIPYMDDNQAGQSWQGLGKEYKALNNHTTNENMLSMICFLLMEDDQQKLIAAVDRSSRIMDKYLSTIKHDGACEEGSAYWKASFGRVYQYSRMMYDFSGGKLNYLDNELLRKMGEYKANAYLGGGYHMNYGDGAPRDFVSSALLYRFGNDTGSRSLANFGLYMMIEQSDKFANAGLINKNTDLFMSLETMRSEARLKKDQNMAVFNADRDMNVLRRQLFDLESVWYPETEYAIFRNGAGWVLTAKGAHNDESHNHNDVGSGMLYISGIPVIVDPGVGIYTADTFGGPTRRYSVWTMRSDWHNLPVINGVLQHYGPEYKAVNTVCDIHRNTLVTEIQNAYESESCCRKWERSYKLSSSSATIVDSYALNERKCADVLNFIVSADVVLPGQQTGVRTVRDGELLLLCNSADGKRNLTVRMSYPHTLTPALEKKDLSDDTKMNANWHGKMARIVFTGRDDAPLEGTYEFKFEILQSDF